MDMQRLIVKGSKKLRGELDIQGAKNSVLPLMAAAVLCGGKVTLKNCPEITDRYAAMRILNHLGCTANSAADIVEADTSEIKRSDIPDELMREMRSSVIFMGALLGRCESCRISHPGGCDLGPRPIDMHIDALRKMGADITEEHGELICSAPDGLHGIKTILSFPSVGTTENLMLAAVLAEGETVISNAAREPEITDLADFLNENGADIKGAGSGTIVINGVKKLTPASEPYSVMPDRIACATYLSFTAACGGEVMLKKCRPQHLEAVLPFFENAGCCVRSFGSSIYIRSSDRLKMPDSVRTMVYPGFPTDAQPMLMAMLCTAEGTAVFTENIFENRYRHAGGLCRMGADIRTEGKIAVVCGVEKLYGAKVSAPDLRGGAALLCGALSAEGISEITNVEFIDRGYQHIEDDLKKLGADVERK